ncbi:MAG: GNAT family N-acetyltransferase [Anaerolineae bacterium]|nr:GNAT family N-acetyltransferase [Anaerolineae bacterium]
MLTANILKGSQIRLTALNEDDLSVVAHWYENAEFMRCFDALPCYPKTKATLGEWLKELQKASDAYVFAIRRQLNNILIGYIELEGILWTHRTGWLSIAIGEPGNWGQGFGTEALSLALNFAFNELNLYRIQATVFSYNERSDALFQKLGFQREGTFREFIQRDGQRYDMMLYGLLCHEYQRHAQKE